MRVPVTRGIRGIEKRMNRSAIADPVRWRLIVEPVKTELPEGSFLEPAAEPERQPG
jgi:hypothetical protein